MLAKRLTFASLIALTSCAPEGPSAFVDLNLAVNEECEVTLTGSTIPYVGRGIYDVAVRDSDAPSDSDFCRRDYVGRLRVNSQLRTNADEDQGRAEPNVIQVHTAEITLRTQDDQVLVFADGLPNPFAQVVNVSIFPSDDGEASVASLNVALIPGSYAESLEVFEGETLIAEVQLFGTTVGDIDVDFKPFPFPVQICNGCLTRCAGEFFMDGEDTRGQILGDVCDDDAGQDGRTCFDQNC